MTVRPKHCVFLVWFLLCNVTYCNSKYNNVLSYLWVQLSHRKGHSESTAVFPLMSPLNASNTVAIYYLTISVIRIFMWWDLALCWEKLLLLCTFLGTEELWGRTCCTFVIWRLCCSVGGLRTFVSSFWKYLGKTWMDLPDVSTWVQMADTSWCLGRPSGWAEMGLQQHRMCVLSKVDLPGPGILGIRKIL